MQIQGLLFPCPAGSQAIAGLIHYNPYVENTLPKAASKSEQRSMLA